MKIQLKEYYRNTPESELIEDVIAVSKKTGKATISANDYRVHGKYHYFTLQRRFRSWYNVLEKAGMEFTKPHRTNMNEVNREILFKNLLEVWIKLRRQPGIRDIKFPLSRYSGSMYIRFFGTWMNALREFAKYEDSNSFATIEAGGENTTAQEGIIKECRTVEKDTPQVSFRLRHTVFLRDGFRCTACGRSPLTHTGVELHCDHVVPWSKGGRTIIDNLKTLCSHCNFGKGNMLTI